jgi:hypothetical protein
VGLVTALVLVVSALVLYTGILLVADSWRRTGVRMDRDMAAMKAAARLSPAREPCRWSNYGNYRICLTHGVREDVRHGDRPYDQDLDGTDLDKWNKEMTS